MENVLDKYYVYIFNEKWVVVSAEEELSEYELSDIRLHLEGEGNFFCDVMQFDETEFSFWIDNNMERYDILEMEEVEYIEII